MRRTLALLLVAGLVAAAPAGAASAPAPGCVVESGSLSWGFKESFRAYIDGSIANGGWTMADGATYDTPSFSWADGSGMVDPDDFTGDIAFSGSVQFTGHGGVLETTIGNPVVRVDGTDRATLLLDVSGPTMAGDPFSATAVEFAEIDLTAVGVLTRQGDRVTIDGAPTVLTVQGSEAFPNYAAGTQFDPVTVAFTVGDDCELALGDGMIGDATPFVMLVIAVGVLLGGGLAVLVAVMLLRRRR